MLQGLSRQPVEAQVLMRAHLLIPPSLLFRSSDRADFDVLQGKREIVGLVHGRDISEKRVNRQRGRRSSDCGAALELCRGRGYWPICKATRSTIMGNAVFCKREGFVSIYDRKKSD